MRDDDNSDSCDEAPRAEDKCYTKGRLRDEFRMKPAPGAEPVRMYKSPYGGKYG
ncbi:3'-5' exonuclease, partial [Salmonella enterica subsp. enterica serovar Enteritidis]|nr:3'-5' exonuclease [Salmonella enterica subsp. enterica serovar Enteritidis]